MRTSRTVAWLTIIVASVFASSGSARADLVISMRTGSSDAEISFVGQGVIGENFGGLLDFNNFGAVFDTFANAQNEFSFVSPISISLFRPSSGNTLIRTYNAIRFNNQVLSDDIVLVNAGGNQFEIGDSFTFNAVTSILGDFSSIPLGSFTADSSGDAGTGRFGVVTLSVTAVPEPSMILLLSAAGISCVIRRSRKLTKMS